MQRTKLTQFHSLIPEGDDEAEREGLDGGRRSLCLDGGRRSLSCHPEQGKVHTYCVKIVESMCQPGDDILPCLRLAPTCNIDVAAFAVPDFDAGSQTLDFNKFRICGIAYLTNSQAQKQAIAFCSCREQGAQAWRAVVLHHHEAHFDDVCGELESLSSKCVHACAILDMCLASNGGIEGAIRASMSTRPGEAGIIHACGGSWMENGEIDSVGGTGSAAGAADEHRPRRAVPRWLPATWQPDPRPQTDIGQPRWRILHSWVSSFASEHSWSSSAGASRQ